MGRISASAIQARKRKHGGAASPACRWSRPRPLVALAGPAGIPEACRTQEIAPRWAQLPSSRGRLRRRAQRRKAAGLSVRLPRRQQPRGRLREMPGHGADRVLRPVGAGEALVQLTAMPRRSASTHPAARMRRLNDRPRHLPVHLGTARPLAGVAAAGMAAGRRARLRGALLGWRKAAHLPPCRGEHPRPQTANAREGRHALARWGGAEHRRPGRLHAADGLIAGLAPGQALGQRVRRGRRDRLAVFLHDLAAAPAEAVPHGRDREARRGKRGSCLAPPQHELGCIGRDPRGDPPGRLDRLPPPGPLAYRLNRDWRVWRTGGQQCLEGTAVMGHAGFMPPVARRGGHAYGSQTPWMASRRPAPRSLSLPVVTPRLPRDARRGGAFIISVYLPVMIKPWQQLRYEWTAPLD
jgi:hypothetical protein